MDELKQYNITAQVYSKFDPYKQTILMNDVLSARCENSACESFKQMYGVDHTIVKIYSVEPV
jgi:hypothetical protein